jgi:hypothetical protein
MTQDERWIARYNEVREFIEQNRRNPSKYNLEQRDMYNWLKATRKKLNAGELKADRVAAFKELLAVCETYRRKNQYE